MAGTKEIKRRIKSVKNTKKITKAMELVAASKMKRAVASTLRSRLYASYSWEILQSIAQNVENITHPLFNNQEHSTGKILLILITSNRGLCGAYNAQVIKKSLALLHNASVDIVTVGKKGDVAMRRVDQNILASFFELPDNISLSDVSPISDLATNEYILGKYDKVLVVYTDFISALTQKPSIKQILPISKAELKEFITLSGLKVSVPFNQSENVVSVSTSINGAHGNQVVNISPGLTGEFQDTANSDTFSRSKSKIDYLFEGDQEKFIGMLAEKITKMQIYQMFLESNASEQSSRMVAMKNASEASGEMIDDLTLVFNKARQSNITREISEISAGMASVS